MTCVRCGHEHTGEPTLFDPHPICGFKEWFQTRAEPGCQCAEPISAEQAEREAIQEERG